MYGRSHLRCHFSGTVSKNNLRFSPIKKKKKENVKWFFSCRYRLKFFVGDHLVSQFNSTQWTNWRMNPLTARMEMESLFANMPASTTTCISPKSSCWEVSKISSETTLSRNVKVTITEIRATRTHERVFTCWTGRRWRLIGQYCDAGCRVSVPFFWDYLTYFNVTFSKNVRVLFGPKVIYMCNFFFSLRHYP